VQLQLRDAQLAEKMELLRVAWAEAHAARAAAAEAEAKLAARAGRH
jgi:hypothetical protein